MFVISQSQSYLWPVAVEFPVDGGKTKKETFDGEFKRLAQSKIKEIQDAIKRDEFADDAALAKDLMVGWKGVVDERGEEIPYSEGARDELLDVPLVATAIVHAWMDSLSGRKRKN